jgi:hypothetical protein
MKLRTNFPLRPLPWFKTTPIEIVFTDGAAPVLTVVVVGPRVAIDTGFELPRSSLSVTIDH